MAESTQAREHKSRNARAQRSASASLQSLVADSGLQQGTIQRVLAEPRASSSSDVIQLQRSIGNRAVSHLLGRRCPEPSTVHTPLQRAVAMDATTAIGPEGGVISGKLEGEIQRANSGGRPLPKLMQQTMEKRTGMPYGNVRIHTDAKADRLSRSLNAEAFTVGQNAYFRKGAYNPTSHSGKQLLAHEMTHVAQQSGGNSGRIQAKLRVGAANDKFEQEADRVAAQPLSPSAQILPARLSPLRTTSVTVQRKIGFTSDRLGGTSLKAKANGMKGDQSTLSLLKEKLDQYHRAQGPAAELECLVMMQDLAGMWLVKHGDNNKKSPWLINLRDLIEHEIPKVKRLIPGGPEEHDEYIRSIESKSLRFITNQGVDIAKNMKDWHSGVENQGEQDEQKKARAARAIATITKNKLTLAEATGIGIFTADDYRYINPALIQDQKWMQGSLPKADVADKNLKDKLRGKIDDESIQGAMAEGILHNKMALSGFKKLPNWKGTTYRGEAYPMQEFTEKYTVGGTRVFDTMSSSSVNRDAADSFILGEATPEKEPIFLTLELKTGKDIQALAHNPMEGEITIMPGTRFKVKSIKQSPMGKFRTQHNVLLVEM